MRLLRAFWRGAQFRDSFTLWVGVAGLTVLGVAPIIGWRLGTVDVGVAIVVSGFAFTVLAFVVYSVAEERLDWEWRQAHRAEWRVTRARAAADIVVGQVVRVAVPPRGCRGLWCEPADGRRVVLEEGP